MPVAHGRQTVGVRTYAQYCPIARASELLGERWSTIILRNILIGCQTFNEIADGAPGLSRGLLSKRLRDLQPERLFRTRRAKSGSRSLFRVGHSGPIDAFNPVQNARATRALCESDTLQYCSDS